MGKVALIFMIFFVGFMLSYYGGSLGLHAQTKEALQERYEFCKHENSAGKANSRIFCETSYPTQGYQVVNKMTGKFVSTTNWFKARDNVEVESCQPGRTPFETFRMESGKEDVKRIVTPYFSVSKNDIQDKCLTVTKVHLRVLFGTCDANSNKDWYFVRVPAAGSVLLLFHAKTRTCIYSDEDNIVRASAPCDPNDPRFLWEIYDKDLSVDHILATQTSLDDFNKPEQRLLNLS